MRYLSSDLFRRRNASSSHPTRRRHPHLPPLYYSVLNRRWAEVRRRARTHPHEIFVQEELSGNTPLHVACRHDPPIDIVRCLLRCADVKNSDGAIPLHLAASHRSSASAIRILIEEGSIASRQGAEVDDDKAVAASACPSSPTQALTRIGRAPIHYACMSFRGLGVEAFSVLLEATIKAPDIPDDTEQDHDMIDLEEMSLMSKDSYSDDDQREEGASTNAMTLRDKTGQTALALLFRRYRERVRCVIKLVEAHARAHGNNLIYSNQSTAAAQAVQADLGELWEKARLIVSTMAEYHLQRDNFERADSCISDFSSCPAESAAASKAAALAASKHQESSLEDEDHSTTTGRKFRIVHASVALTGYGCPPEMIRLAISVHPHQVCEMDEEGRLPIHVAAIAASSLMPSHDAPSLDDDSASIFTSNTFSSYTNVDVKNPFDQIIRILLRHYPQSARIPHGINGRLPFALAVDAGRRTWDDGLKALFNAYPAAVESRDDIAPQLYPNIFSLIGKAYDENEHEGVVRARPTAFQKRSRLVMKQKKTLSSVFDVLRAKPNLIVQMDSLAKEEG